MRAAAPQPGSGPSVVGRVWQRLRSSGIVDGIWTAAASFGSKVQALVALGIAGRMGDIEGLGLFVLATSTAILTCSAADLGLSSHVVRAFAAGGVRERRALLPQLAVRLAISVPLAIVVALVIAAVRGDVPDPLLWVGMITLYNAAYLASLLVTQLAYGMGRFRGGATLNGVVRTATIPLLLAVSFTGWTPLVLLGVLALGELVIAVLQYRKAPATNPAPPGQPIGLSIKDSWRLGIGPIVNTVMSRSDTVIISGIASSRALGIYGVASQVENALTTAALIPAGAAMTYAARTNDPEQARRHRRTVGSVVALTYAVIGVPMFVFAGPLTELVLGVTLDDLTPVRVLVVAGLFSSLGSVAMKIITGQGRQNTVAGIWLTTAGVTLIAMVTGAYLAGALGAAIGAGVRDLAFFVLTWVAVRRTPPDAAIPEPREAAALQASDTQVP